VAGADAQGPAWPLLAQVEGGYDHNFVLFSMGPQAKFIARGGMASST
jgi:hypothetical protein